MLQIDLLLDRLDLIGRDLKGQVTAIPGHLSVRSLTSVSNSWSLVEPPSWERVGNLTEKRLPGWLSATQGVETDVMCVEIHDILKSELDSAESDSKPSCNLAHWNAASHRRNHLASALFGACFLVIAFSLTGGLPPIIWESR